MARPVIGDDPFRAISHPVRRSMLDMLRKGPKTAADLVAAFRLSQPSISQHLAILRDARLVRARQRGRHLIYSIDARPLRTVHRWTGAHVR